MWDEWDRISKIDHHTEVNFIAYQKVGLSSSYRRKKETRNDSADLSHHVLNDYMVLI